MMPYVKSTMIAMGCVLLLAMAATADETEDLAKQSQNPIANLISLPFEFKASFNAGSENNTIYGMDVKPVYPANLGDWLLINRFIIPVIYQEKLEEGQGSKFGLGDINYQAFFTPAEAGNIIWGVGPSIYLPTNTDDRLGVDQWSAGPAAVALATPGHWLFGILAQNIWSITGEDDEPDVHFFSAQLFINYNLDDGWYLTSSPTFVADWEADSDNTWTVPIGGGVGRLVRFGNQPVDFKVQSFWNAEHPDNTPDWNVQFQVKFLFPK